MQAHQEGDLQIQAPVRTEDVIGTQRIKIRERAALDLVVDVGRGQAGGGHRAASQPELVLVDEVVAQIQRQTGAARSSAGEPFGAGVTAATGAGRNAKRKHRRDGDERGERRA